MKNLGSIVILIGLIVISGCNEQLTTEQYVANIRAKREKQYQERGKNLLSYSREKETITEEKEEPKQVVWEKDTYKPPKLTFNNNDPDYKKQQRTQTPTTDSQVSRLISSGAVIVNVEFNEVRIKPSIWLALTYQQKQGFIMNFSNYFDSKGSTGRVNVFNAYNDTKLGKYSVWTGVKIYY